MQENYYKGQNIFLRLAELRIVFGEILRYTKIKEKNDVLMLYSNNNVFIADNQAVGAITNATDEYVDVDFLRRAESHKMTLEINLSARFTVDEAKIGLMTIGETKHEQN